jgi:hypothetical protein
MGELLDEKAAIKKNGIIEQELALRTNALN